MIQKTLVHIWLVTCALAGILAGCGHAPHYDERLIQADSLLRLSDMTQRKATLQQLESLDAHGLSNDADRAYYSLLLTQAQYINYIRFTSDSAINAAVDYYEHHDSEVEKLTRSYIYKGAVYEDLNRPDSAMLFYKKAYATAGEEDAFNRGYAQLRMGKLYTNHHAYDGRDIEKLEQALDYFKLSKDTTYQIICLKDLGAIYRSSNSEKAEKTLNEAISLAEKQKDINNLINCHNILAYLYFMQGQKDKANFKKAYKQLQNIKKYGLEGLPSNVYTTFACVYANMGMPDSATTYLNMAGKYEQDTLYRGTTTYMEAKSQIAKAQGDEHNYLKLSYTSDRISFQSLQDPDIVNIMYAENDFDREHAKMLESKQRQARYTTGAIVAAVILSLLALALLFYRRAHRYDRLIVELKDQSQSQMNDLSDLQGNINEMKINDERLKGFISSHMGMMREMIEACYREPNNRIAENMKRIVKFQDSNKDNWAKLYDYIDMEHNNIMTRTREQYPQLNDRDLLLLALTSMGFSYIQTAIIMGYSNATSVSVIKQRLAQKMGLESSLNEYINQYGNNDNSPKT